MPKRQCGLERELEQPWKMLSRNRFASLDANYGRDRMTIPGSRSAVACCNALVQGQEL